MGGGGIKSSKDYTFVDILILSRSHTIFYI